jgi:WD40 repeat protein
MEGLVEPEAQQRKTLNPVWSASLEAPVNHVVVLDGMFAFLCGDGSALFVAEHGLSENRRQLHSGAILAACAGPRGVLSGGDDGRVLLSSADGSSELIRHHAGTWIDAVALSPKGDLAWTAGRVCYRRGQGGELWHLECASTPSDIQFDPKGRRLAIAQYGGVWLWLAKQRENLVRKLVWKGSHISVTWSLDGATVVTAMQERELHGWRLSDGANMRMSGYPGKIGCISWNASGSRLATAGAPVAVVWPFDRGGPWNRRPEEYGFLAAGITKLAWHPERDVLAAGCQRGELKLMRSEDGSEVDLGHIRNAPVTAIAWSRSGRLLAAGTQSGQAEIHAFAHS